MKNELKNVSSISVDFSKLLGIGGESIVFRKFINSKEKALKVAPYGDISDVDKNIIQTAQANISGSKALERQVSNKGLEILEKSSEFSSSKLRHENLLCYDNVIMDVVNNDFAVVIGKLEKF